MKQSRRSAVWVMSLVLVLGAVLLHAPPAEAAREMVLRVGESRSIFLGRIKSVSVGNDQVIDVKKHPDGNKVIVFGVSEGYSSLTVGDIRYDINVVGNIEKLRRDVESLISGMPGLRVLALGDRRVIVDGEVRNRQDFERILTLVAANPRQIYSFVTLIEKDIIRRDQVQLHFQILEVQRDRDHQIGINWDEPIRLVLDTVSYIQFGLGDIANTAGGFGADAVRTPDSHVRLGSRVNIRRVLDKDFFTTISGEEVKFFRGRELLIKLEGAQTVDLKVIRVGLDVVATPVVDEDGDIDLQIKADYRTVSDQSVDGLPVLASQSHEARVQLREGESFALSGFFSRSRGRSISGLPGLKDIPGLGVLFGSRNWRRGQSDGIIVITPVLISEDRRSMRKQIKETLDIYDAADVKW